MLLLSTPPHDFFLCLDVDQYFDLEHDPERIFDEGFTRSVPAGDRDVLITIRFNGDPENPSFSVQFHEPVSKTEEQEAEKAIRRILGCDLDVRPLYDQAGNDPVLGPMLSELYGLKRVTRANFFEDAMNRIIQSQISHKPTARKMVYGVREAFGTRMEGPSGPIAAWPRPHRLLGADAVGMKNYGLSERKGEYIIGLAHEMVSGNLDSGWLETADPMEFYNRICQIRGIGPTTAQDLMLMRNRTDAIFPSRMEKNEERGLRYWIIRSYGGDPHHTTEKDFQAMTAVWKGFEAPAIEFLFVNWVLSYKKVKGES